MPGAGMAGHGERAVIVLAVRERDAQHRRRAQLHEQRDAVGVFAEDARILGARDELRTAGLVDRVRQRARPRVLSRYRPGELSGRLVLTALDVLPPEPLAPGHGDADPPPPFP